MEIAQLMSSLMIWSDLVPGVQIMKGKTCLLQNCRLASTYRLWCVHHTQVNKHFLKFKINKIKIYMLA